MIEGNEFGDFLKQYASILAGKVSSDKPVIVIDVGHGWTGERFDEGARRINSAGEVIQPEVCEYDLNVKHAQILKAKLEERGFEVFLTSDQELRSCEADIDNFDSRHKIAEDKNAVLYLSLHVDSYKADTPLGVRCYYDKNEKNVEAIKLSELMSDWCCSIYDPIKKEERNAPIRKIYKGIKTDIYHVPAVLIEMGNMQNQVDYLNMTNDKWLDETFESMANAVKYKFGAKGAVKAPVEVLTPVSTPVNNERGNSPKLP